MDGCYILVHTHLCLPQGFHITDLPGSVSTEKNYTEIKKNVDMNNTFFFLNVDTLCLHLCSSSVQLTFSRPGVNLYWTMQVCQGLLLKHKPVLQSAKSVKTILCPVSQGT